MWEEEVRSDLSQRTLAEPEPSCGEAAHVYTDHTEEEIQGSWNFLHLEITLWSMGDLTFQNRMGQGRIHVKHLYLRSLRQAPIKKSAGWDAQEAVGMSR